jgi:hypothetical protein
VNNNDEVVIVKIDVTPSYSGYDTHYIHWGKVGQWLEEWLEEDDSASMRYTILKFKNKDEWFQYMQLEEIDTHE